MSSSDLNSIIQDLKTGDFRISPHARTRMFERGVERADIERVASNFIDTEEQDNGRWCLSGFDCQGDPLDIICAYNGNTVVVTVKG